METGTRSVQLSRFCRASEAIGSSRVLGMEQIIKTRSNAQPNQQSMSHRSIIWSWTFALPTVTLIAALALVMTTDLARASSSLPTLQEEDETETQSAEFTDADESPTSSQPAGDTDVEPVVMATSPVGVTRVLEDLVIDGPELEVVPLEDRLAPLALRIVESRPHGTSRRYQIEYYGLEPGQFDLGQFLTRIPSGNETAEATMEIPALMVEFTPMLPAGQIEPNALTPTQTPRLGGYQLLLIVLSVVWILGLGLIIFWRGKKSRDQTITKRPVSLAEAIRPLIDRAVKGEAGHQELAELERSLITYWRMRLQLKETQSSAAITELLQHPEASRLIRQLEEWLHNPSQTDEVDIDELLRPYRDISESEFARVAGPLEGTS